MTYDADATPTFTQWKEPDAVRAFDAALRVYLATREPSQSEAVLRERVKLHGELEELLATPAMKTLRASADRLQAEGMSRAETLDAMVALTASFGLDEHDEHRSLQVLHALTSTNAQSLRATFPDGPTPVIATHLALVKQRSRNQRRRRR